MFAEDLSPFFDVSAGFAVTATRSGLPITLILDAPGVEVFDDAVATTEPSALVQASDSISVGQQLVLGGGSLPTTLAHLAGTYSVRSVYPEPLDGALERAYLAKAA